MIRVLLIARYRHPTMLRKAQALAAYPEMHLRTVIPVRWQDHFFSTTQTDTQSPGEERFALPMLGNPTDPHRALYRTLTFGMRAFHPHIVHAEEEPDSLAALQIVLARRIFAPRAKLILHTWQNLDRPKALHVRAVLRVTLSAADAVFCANREAVALLRRWGYTRPAPLIPAIGVDTETFRPCKPPDSQVFNVGYVGRLVPEKGVDTLLEAVAQLQSRGPGRPATVTLVGDGPSLATLQKQITRLGLSRQITFLGPMTPEQVAEQLCSFHALVLPSRTTPVWKEQLGRVLLEAMAAGVPVIGSDSGAIPEVIGEAGLIFPEGDAAALARHLANLAGDPVLWSELRHRGLARAQEYSQTELAARTLTFYRELLS